MAEKNPNSSKGFSLDWLIQGVLTRLGEALDGLTGRKWKPTSSLATSELIEKLKRLLDTEVQDLGVKGRFVPHNIELKMQWDKFSTDAENALQKLEAELLTAAVDHINDKRYHTFAPLKLVIKTDYFTDGVKLLASFDKLADEDGDAEVNVTMPNAKAGDLYPAKSVPAANVTEIFIARFDSNETAREAKLRFQNNARLSVGRGKENALSIDDTSVSKVHASLFLNAENNLTIADTGSTNGTFINGERISYGKAQVIGSGDKITFGTVNVSFEHVPKPVEDDLSLQNSVTIDGFEFKSKSDSKSAADTEILNQNPTKVTVE